MSSAPAQFRLIGRLLMVSAVVILAMAIAIWNGFVDLDPDVRPVIAGALTFAGLLDIGLGIVMLRRGQS
jgi:hypothetical protein